MSEQDKIINRLEGDVELRDQNIAELCEDFTSALTAFRALSQQFRNVAQRADTALANGDPWDAGTAYRQSANEIDALLWPLYHTRGPKPDTSAPISQETEPGHA